MEGNKEAEMNGRGRESRRSATQRRCQNINLFKLEIFRKKHTIITETVCTVLKKHVFDLDLVQFTLHIFIFCLSVIFVIESKN